MDQTILVPNDLPSHHSKTGDLYNSTSYIWKPDLNFTMSSFHTLHPPGANTTAADDVYFYLQFQYMYIRSWYNPTSPTFRIDKVDSSLPHFLPFPFCSNPRDYFLHPRPMKQHPFLINLHQYYQQARPRAVPSNSQHRRSFPPIQPEDYQPKNP